ncbi:hypothetical protein GCM10023215_38750 [Pseudonocardia yuanmonensis]|uniref:Uncharacterized protein n=1 Tax=Pseudonocardia yuanmonensis TaxID=1095914 RepID=A0ABP8WYK0_9PSEU
MTTREARIRRRHAGLVGALTGRGRSRLELAVEAGAFAVLLALLAGYVGATGGWGTGALGTVVLAVVAVDLVGGTVTTLSTAAKRERHGRAFRLGFVACHTVHFAVVGAVFATGWAWPVVNAAWLVMAALLIEWTRLQVRRVVAVTASVSGVLAGLLWLPVPPYLAWIPGLLFLKLLVGFLVPEAPPGSEEGVGSMGTSAH